MKFDIHKFRALLLVGVATAGAAAVGTMLWFWYPAPLFHAAGTAKLPAALAAAAFAGAALAVLLPAWRRKPLGEGAQRGSMVALVAVFTGCALALYVQRPVFLVYTGDRFDLVLARDLARQDLAKAPAEFSSRPLGGPRYVAALQPKDPAEMQRIADRALEGGKDLQAYPQYYVAYAGEAKNALKRAQPLSKLWGRDDEALRRGLEAAGRTPEDVRFLPLRARKRDGIVLIDVATGMPAGEVLVDPW